VLIAALLVELSLTPRNALLAAHVLSGLAWTVFAFYLAELLLPELHSTSEEAMDHGPELRRTRRILLAVDGCGAGTLASGVALFVVGDLHVEGTAGWVLFWLGTALALVAQAVGLFALRPTVASLPPEAAAPLEVLERGVVVGRGIYLMVVLSLVLMAVSVYVG
jgi:uncharacterized membrane protein